MINVVNNTEFQSVTRPATILAPMSSLMCPPDPLSDLRRPPFNPLPLASAGDEAVGVATGVATLASRSSTGFTLSSQCITHLAATANAGSP
jgi:hypothetical protein